MSNMCLLTYLYSFFLHLYFSTSRRDGRRDGWTEDNAQKNKEHDQDGQDGGVDGELIHKSGVVVEDVRDTEIK